METDGRKRSDNFEDRGVGDGGYRSAGAFPVQLLFALVRLLGFKGALLVGVLVAGFTLLPASLKQRLLGGDPGPAPGGASVGSVCKASPGNARACDFSRVVLASTEEVWAAKFQSGHLPRYGRAPGAYRDPTLVVFSRSVQTGCGSATSAVGPFYCSADRRLYVDPDFYRVMEQRLRAPGDFAQAYVIAHEVGHHVQTLIGAMGRSLPGESRNQSSVRVELQADCLAGVWGRSARASLAIDDRDLGNALNAAHAIGDDALGHSRSSEYTHGTSEQRMRWFRRGFDSGDARQCDTFQIERYRDL